MLWAYINYPNPHITVHRDQSCSSIQKQNKHGQRYLKVNMATISKELICFSEKKYPFASKSEVNDMWLEIDFGDSGFENSILDYIRQLIGNHYSPLMDVIPDNHCP